MSAAAKRKCCCGCFTDACATGVKYPCSILAELGWMSTPEYTYGSWKHAYVGDPFPYPCPVIWWRNKYRNVNTTRPNSVRLFRQHPDTFGSPAPDDGEARYIGFASWSRTVVKTTDLDTEQERWLSNRSTSINWNPSSIFTRPEDYDEGYGVMPPSGTPPTGEVLVDTVSEDYMIGVRYVPGVGRQVIVWRNPADLSVLDFPEFGDDPGDAIFYAETPVATDTCPSGLATDELSHAWEFSQTVLHDQQIDPSGGECYYYEGAIEGTIVTRQGTTAATAGIDPAPPPDPDVLWSNYGDLTFTAEPILNASCLGVQSWRADDVSATYMFTSNLDDYGDIITTTVDVVIDAQNHSPGNPANWTVTAPTADGQFGFDRVLEGVGCNTIPASGYVPPGWEVDDSTQSFTGPGAITFAHDEVTETAFEAIPQECFLDTIGLTWETSQYCLDLTTPDVTYRSPQIFDAGVGAPGSGKRLFWMYNNGASGPWGSPLATREDFPGSPDGTVYADEFPFAAIGTLYAGDCP